MLISIAIHRKTQLVLEMAMIELVIRVIIVIIINGLFRLNIKSWWDEAPNIKLEALVYQIRFNLFNLEILHFIRGEVL